MDLSKIKDVFKSYSSLLIPVAIGVVAVVLFIPTQLMSSRLKERVGSDSVRQGRTIQLLNSNPVSLKQWERVRDYQDKHANDANTIEALVRQTTQRNLLSYGLFPKPEGNFSTMIFRQFGDVYRGRIEQLIANVNARDCPSNAELDNIRKGWSAKKSYRGRRTREKEVGTVIVDQICRKRAQIASVYANADDLDGYSFWGAYIYSDESMEAAMKDCWYSQLAYWVVEDMFATVGSMNADSSSVLDSPVKRLIDVRFPDYDSKTRRRRSKRSKAVVSDNKPRYVLSADRGAVETCTKRVSDTLIDVIHFETSVVVKVADILGFMRELSSVKSHEFAGWDGSRKDNPEVFKHNQMTILECKVSAVDRDSPDHKNYRYGEDAVATLELTCEYVFDKASYEHLIPDAVKEDIKTIQAEIAKEEKKRAKRARLLGVGGR